MHATENIGKLEEEARKRKERLEQLRSKQNQEQNQIEESENKQSLPKPKFRSYAPQDEDLKKNSLPRAETESVSDQVKEELASGASEPLVDEIDLTSIAPRKIDWDLKRNLAKKLDKLERRTQRAIAEIIRDRLKEENSELGPDVSQREG